MKKILLAGLLVGTGACAVWAFGAAMPRSPARPPAVPAAAKPGLMQGPASTAQKPAAKQVEPDDGDCG